LGDLHAVYGANADTPPRLQVSSRIQVDAHGRRRGRRDRCWWGGALGRVGAGFVRAAALAQAQSPGSQDRQRQLKSASAQQSATKCCS